MYMYLRYIVVALKKEEKARCLRSEIIKYFVFEIC